MSKKLELPGIYSRWLWEKGGSIPEYEKFLGMPYVSNSQVSTYTSKSGFNTWKPGHLEWIQNKLLGYDWPDVGWAQFGKEVETVIRKEEGYEEYLDNFTERELAILDTVEPLGLYERHVIVDMSEHGFIVIGFIDDMTPFDEENKRVDLIRDYKTASVSSSKRYGGKDDFQSDLYVKGIEQLGYEVGGFEYFIIERGGGGPLFKDKSLGRGALTVDGVLGVKEVVLKDWEVVENHFVKATKEMQRHFKMYKKLIDEQ